MKKTNSRNCFLCTFWDLRYFFNTLLETYPTIYWKLDNNLEVTKQQHTNIHKMLPSFCLPTNMGPFKSATRKLCTLFFSHKHGSLQELHAFKKLVFSKNIWAPIRGRMHSILALPLFTHYFFYFFGKSLGSI
jgi:hypothetical protein